MWPRKIGSVIICGCNLKFFWTCSTVVIWGSTAPECQLKLVVEPTIMSDQEQLHGSAQAWPELGSAGVQWPHHVAMAEA